MKINNATIGLSILLFILNMSCTSDIAQKKVGEKTAPGTVDVTAILNSIKNEGNQAIVELKITKINSYGPAASPIAVNSILTAVVSLSDVKSGFEKTPIASSINVILKLKPTGVNVRDLYKWEITQISNHNN